jgi:hypothetical protein
MRRASARRTRSRADGPSAAPDRARPAIISHPPGDRPDVRAGLATHPGQLEPFGKLLVSGVAKTALSAATKALETVHGSLSDMHAATSALASQRPEDRMIGPKGNVIYVAPIVFKASDTLRGRLQERPAGADEG